MLSVLLISASMSFGAEPATATVWPGFRGDGTSRSRAEKLPVEWSPEKNIAWKTGTKGYGQSSPVIWNDRAFVTSVEGEQKETYWTTCLRLKDGKELWSNSIAASLKGKNNPMMSRAAGTPVVDATGVYCLFDSGDVAAYDLEGNPLWNRALGKELGELKNNHGLGSSPAQTEKHVIVLLDHQGPGKLFALNKTDGKDAWTAERPARSSWTSPIIVAVGQSRQVVVSSGGAVTGYDATTGKQLWEKTGFVGNSIPSATHFGDRVVIAAGENRMKPDAEGTSKSNCCLQLGSGDPETVWTGKKLATGTASPVISDGFAYFVDKAGILICLDAKTGVERYRERLDQPQWATPIAAGDRLYCFGKDGTTTVVKAGGDFEKLASNKFWSDDAAAKRKEEAKKNAKLPEAPGGGRGPGNSPPTSKDERESALYSAIGDIVYGAAVVDGCFVIRTGTEVICIRKK